MTNPRPPGKVETVTTLEFQTRLPLPSPHPQLPNPNLTRASSVRPTSPPPPHSHPPTGCAGLTALSTQEKLSKCLNG